MRNFLLCALCCLALAGCSATSYSPRQQADGYMEEEVGPNLWRVSFLGNARTSLETVQTYWLYRCAELTRERGFDGFEIVSTIVLTQGDPYASYQEARAAPAPIFIYTGPGTVSVAPSLVAEIKLLRNPIKQAVRKTYEAGALLRDLEPHVKGEKCVKGNVCPYIHDYINPDFPGFSQPSAG